MNIPTLEEAPFGSRPIAVVLSGGGAYGSWQGGALYELAQTLQFHSILGTSAGALNGVAYAQNDTALIKTIWRDMPRSRFLRFSPRLAPPSLLSMDAIRRYLETIVDEKKCREARRCWFYVVSTDVLNDGLCQATYSPAPGGPWDGPLLDHILGSIAIPFVMPPVEIKPTPEGAPRRILCDGHIISFAALRPLALRGARDFLFLGVAGPGRHETKRASIAGMIHILVHQLLRAQVSNSLTAMSHDTWELGLRFFEFNPMRPMSLNVLGFKRDECRKGFDWGVEDAKKFVSAPLRFQLGADLSLPAD